MSALPLIINWHLIIFPLELAVIIAGFTFQNTFCSIRERNHKIKIRNHKGIQRMAVHVLILVYFKPSLSGEDHRDQFFQTISNLFRNPVVLLRINPDRFPSDLIIIEISPCSPRGNSHHNRSLTASDSKPPVLQPFLPCQICCTLNNVWFIVQIQHLCPPLFPCNGSGYIKFAPVILQHSHQFFLQP